MFTNTLHKHHLPNFCPTPPLPPICSQDLVDNLEASICNLDMILRWVSLRFFDTNPSVIIKVMDYLQCVFSSLTDDGYSLMDFEAYSFLPFLVQKVCVCGGELTSIVESLTSLMVN